MTKRSPRRLPLHRRVPVQRMLPHLTKSKTQPILMQRSLMLTHQTQFQCNPQQTRSAATVLRACTPTAWALTCQAQMQVRMKKHGKMKSSRMPATLLAPRL